MTIGELIRNQRESLGLTLEAVGQAVGVSRATVSRWESGDIHKMKRDKIAALAETLNINPVLLVMPDDVLTESERRLVAAYRAADDRAKADAIAMLESHPK